MRHSALSEITENLYLSGIGGINAENLQAAKITHVINMAVELDEYSYPDLDLQIHKFSLRDSVDEDIYIRLEECVQLIDDIQKDGGRILVHCVAGVSRSATVCIAYLVKIHQISLRDAYQHVLECRNVVFPNNGFWRALIQYEACVRGVNSVEMRPYISGMEPDSYLGELENERLTKELVVVSFISEARIPGVAVWI
uniref:Protein-tyrosine-phosphatase n=1 Tax=Magallana gigas TaxID=29159 RepID=A0A8W8JJ05_MAGGI